MTRFDWRRVFTYRRIWRLEVLLGSLAMALLITVSGHSLAQIRHAAEQFDRDERRIERKVDALQKDHEDLKLSLERRLVKMETQMSAGVWLISAIAGIMVLGVGDRLLGLILHRRAQVASKGENS